MVIMMSCFDGYAMVIMPGYAIMLLCCTARRKRVMMPMPADEASAAEPDAPRRVKSRVPLRAMRAMRARRVSCWRDGVMFSTFFAFIFFRRFHSSFFTGSFFVMLRFLRCFIIRLRPIPFFIDYYSSLPILHH